MRNLGNGKWQCPRCGGVIDAGDPSMPKRKRNWCKTCQRAQKQERKGLMVTYLPPVTRSSISAAMAARRKLEEMRDAHDL